MQNILIVEDNEIARINLGEIIRSVDESYTVLQAGTVQEAIQLLKTQKIDLFFLDIELPDGSGIELAIKIRDMQEYICTHIVFITSHMEYMVTALKKIHCYDYITKPFHKQEIIDVVVMIQKGLRQQKSDILKETPSILIQVGDFTLKIRTEEIVFAEITNRQCTIHTDQQKYSIPYMTLKQLKKLLPSDRFMKSHRAFLVHKERIQRIDKKDDQWEMHFEGYNEVALIGKTFLRSVIDEVKKQDNVISMEV